MARRKSFLSILLLLILAAVLVIGGIFAWNASNGGTNELKTFYIKVDGEKITETGTMALDDNKIEIFGIGSVIDSITGNGKGYSYRVVLKNDYIFVVDSMPHSLSEKQDYTDAFSFISKRNGFIIETTSLQDVCTTMFEGQSYAFSDYDEKTAIFTLQIFNHDESAMIAVEFSLPFESLTAPGIVITPGHIYF